MAKMNKKHCVGCYQDRYNHKGMCERPGIDAVVVSNECWNLERAKRVRKVEIPIHQIPPYTQKSIWVPDCYSKTGFVYISPNNIKNGYIR